MAESNPAEIENCLPLDHQGLPPGNQLLGMDPLGRCLFVMDREIHPSEMDSPRSETGRLEIHHFVMYQRENRPSKAVREKGMLSRLVTLLFQTRPEIRTEKQDSVTVQYLLHIQRPLLRR